MKNLIHITTRIALSIASMLCLGNTFGQVISNNGSVSVVSSGMFISAVELNNTSGTFINNGSLNLSGNLSNGGIMYGNGTTSIAGNWSNNGTFTAAASTINFNGNDQWIGGSKPSSFFNAIISGGGNKTLTQPITIRNLLNFNRGYIVSDATNKLIISDSANVSNASDASYVFGPVQKIGSTGLNNSTFTFPTGQSDYLYDPVKIKFLEASKSMAFTVTHYHQPSGVIMPSDIAIKADKSNLDAFAQTLSTISLNEYWDIQNDDPDGDKLSTSGVDLTMHYHNSILDNTSPTYMNILHHNGTLWEVSNSANQVSTLEKTLGLNAYSILLPSQKSFSPFTIGGSASALPVTLLNFTAKATIERTASIIWSTTSETRSKGFGIERNSGGVNGKYERIGYVASRAVNGNSQTALYYNFIDKSPGMGETVFYRLALENLDGIITYSGVRVVKFNNQTVSVIYPNPTRGVVNISRTANGSKMNIQVTDMSGKLIQQINNVTDSNYKLNINYSGMYNIKLIYPETGEQTIQKIVVQK